MKPCTQSHDHGHFAHGNVSAIPDGGKTEESGWGSPSTCGDRAGPTTATRASQRDQNPAVSLRNPRPPAVLAKSKLTDRRVLRFALICSQRTPHNKTPILAGTFEDTRDLRLSGLANSAISPLAPPPTSWTPFPTQLSPLSDSHVAPGYHPFGPHRMSKYTQLRSVSSLRRSEI
jgi:hypothetical protein